MDHLTVDQSLLRFELLSHIRVNQSQRMFIKRITYTACMVRFNLDVHEDCQKSRAV